MRSRIAIVAFILSVVAVVAAVWATVSPIVVKQDAAAVQSQAKTLADQVAEACAKGGPAAAELVQRGACAKAAEVKDQAPVAQASVQPDPAQLRQAAKTAVAEYCAAPTHPCRGSDGSTPPFEAIVDAVVAKIPAPKNGDDGQDGANATATQVASAVAAYCGQPDEPCRGKAGTNGTNGQTPTCVSEPSECRGADGQPPAGWTTTYPDGSTGSCTRAPDFDPAAPRYTCTRSAPPSTDPPLPLGGS
ncbi:hypothetical protein VA596_41740 [Amycolatopsis sp., V23-08]|uniref:Uncharacterized protein n=1 Tax=Amycolatopsis heterodermiae TaxID=3110235 RepID=A0ABU5RJV9_9PSEU|nr:hypothetical protein [Amycolatopsis sp., V23-08]MEA5366110.1 hypothetical protein [Amycolatopsis sp., V23-08]